MSTAALRGVVRGLVLDGPASDAALVTRYSRLNDHGAFAELLRRHGPVVLGVCRRALGHADADDAFQAVFLVLARRAGCIRPPGAVGGWLYGVAVRTAKKAKVAAARRWRREMSRMASPGREAGDAPGYPGAYAPGSPEHGELRSVIDAELARLPDKLRLPVVLCDLGGKTRSEAARELGLPDGTVAARLHQARKLLADRLSRRGVALPAAGLGVLAAAEPVSADLARVTLAAAEAFARGSASPVLSTTAQALAEGVVRAMNAGTWKLGLGAILAAGLLAGGGIMWAANGTGPAPPGGGGKGEAAKPEAKMTIDAPGYVADVSFSTDGKQYAVVAGGKVTVHDAATGKVRWTALGEAARFVHQPASEVPVPDEKAGVRMITAPAQDSLWVMGPTGVTIREPESGRDIGVGPGAPARPRPKTDKGWHVVRFSPDGKRYAVRPGDEVRVYDTTTGFEPARLGDQHGPSVGTTIGLTVREGSYPRDVFFSPDGKKVVGVGVFIEPARVGFAVWNAQTGERVQALAESAPGGGPMAAAYSPDGKTFAAAYTDHIALWGEPKVAPPDAADRIERGPLRGPKRLAMPGTPTAVAFSPDGKTLAVGVWVPSRITRVGRYDPRVYLFDAATGKELRRFDDFAPGLAVSALAFSPDGKQLAAGTGHRDGLPVIADPPKAGEVKVFALTPEPAPPPPKADPPAVVERNQDLWAWQERPRPKDTDPVHSVAFAPGGKAFAVGRPTREVVARDAATLKTLWEHTFDYPHMTGIEPNHPAGVAYSPDGRLLAVSRAGGTTLLEAATGKTVRSYPARGGAPTAVAFGPDGGREGIVGPPVFYRLALTDGRSVWAMTWVDGFEPGTSQFGPLADAPKVDKPHAGVAYSPDGGRLVFIPNNKIDPRWPAKAGDRPDPQQATHWYAQVWGGGSGEPMAFLPHGPDPVTAVAWSPDGRIATADDRGMVVIWDGATYKERKRVKLSGPVTALTFRSDGKRLAAGVRHPPAAGGDKGITQVEVFTEQEGSSPDNWMISSTLGLPPEEVVQSLAISPDGLVMVAGTATADGKGGGLRVWDRRKLAPVEGPGQKPVPAAAPGTGRMSADDRWEQRAFDRPDGFASAAAFAPGGKTFAVANPGPDAAVVLWDTATLKAGPTLRRGKESARAVAFTPDGAAFAVAGDDAVVRYDVPKAGRPGPWRGAQPAVPFDRAAAVAFSPDGKWLALSNGHTAGFRAWDEANGAAFATGPDEPKPLIGKLPAGVAWSPDSKRLAQIQPTSPDADGVVGVAGVWPGPDSNPGNLVGHKGPVTAVAWSPGGTVIATGGADGTVILWDAATYQEKSRTEPVGRGGKSTIHALAFSPDRKTLAAAVEYDEGKNPKRVVLLDAATGRRLEDLQDFPKGPPVALAFSPDGRTLVAACGRADDARQKLPPDERIKFGEVKVFTTDPAR
ncbi:MAG: sigma-70 family RNA polymerase sigma factor [Gemmataceae bacterium]|nr:sigma-70 family RNA polymerase sigma factor [Gemmataceae bacterium]